MFNKKIILLIMVVSLISVSLLGCSENEIIEEEVDGVIQIEEDDEEISEEDDEEIIEDLKSEFDVKWDWRDIAYDIANSKRREFLISGRASLSDYYNYGYSDNGYNKKFEKEYFSVSVTPFQVNGQSSERWHLYLHREAFKNLFEELKKGDLNVTGVAELSSHYYRDGQGMMALAKKLRY